MLKKAMFCVLVFIVLCLAVRSQSKSVAIPLETISDNRVFRDISTTTKLIQDSIRFKNIPGVFKTYRILQWPKDANEAHVYILYGRDDLGRRGVIIDSDLDFDVGDELVNYFPTDISYSRQASTETEKTIKAVKITVPGFPSQYVKPDLYNCCRRGLSPDDSTWFMAIVTAYEKRGTIRSGNKDYIFCMQASSSLEFKMNSQTAVIASDVETLKKSYETNPVYQAKEVFYLDNRKYVFDSVNVKGDTAWITEHGIVSKPVGPRLGEYAPQFQSQDFINHASFSLQSMKGKYVLIDFWGSWCGPCIEMIPDLKKLHTKYAGTEFRFVSIAFDERQQIPALKSLIKEHQMNWSHLFDNSQETSTICTLFRVYEFPTTILIDPSGKIIFRGAGLDGVPKLDSLLKTLEKR